MPFREHVLSLLFVAFLLLKAAEAVFGLEAWPASNTSMFSGWRPASVIPHRCHLMATRSGVVEEMHAIDFLLSQDEFETSLSPDPDLGVRCEALVRSWNRRQHDPGRRIRVAHVEVEPIARPGVASNAKTWTVVCTSLGTDWAPR